MYKKIVACFLFLFLLSASVRSQINTDYVMMVGRNALYYDDYVLSIQYFNQVIKVKPFLAEPYFFRAVAKLYLDDFKGAEEDCSLCLERNPFVINAYQVRGMARQNMEDYEGAVADYTKGLEYAPEHKAMMINKAVAEIYLKRYDEAEKSFEALINRFPTFYNAYLGECQLYIEKGDTLKALEKINKAIEVDKYSSPAYMMRAMIKVEYNKDYQSALDDVNEAIKIEPMRTDYYLNRGLIRYYLKDIRGTLADYDKVIDMDANNVMAYYNRGILRAQVGDKNRAIDDFTEVINREPDNYFALYNRAILCDELGQYQQAEKDYSRVIEQYPNFVAGFYARSEVRRKLGDDKGAEEDYMYVMQKRNFMADANHKDADEDTEEVSTEEKTRKESDKNIRKFSQLIVADNRPSKYASEYRGRVQDKGTKAELSDSFILTYYEKLSDITQYRFYDRKIDALNQSHILNKRLLITNAEVALDQSQIDEHFKSIEDYSAQIGNNQNLLAAYFARSLDYMLVQDFEGSIDDLDKVIEIDNTFMYAYFNRAAVRFKKIESMFGQTQSQDNTPASLISEEGISEIKNMQLKNGAGFVIKDDQKTVVDAPVQNRAIEYDLIVRDYNKVISLDPGFVYAYYNRANVYSVQKNYKAALADYDEAIKLAPEFADAYYNRAMIYLITGKTELARADLSKAGELGKYESYNLLKRLND